MIIEDEQDLLNLYKDFLVNKGYHVSVTNTTASNIMGDYEEFRPDLVILDYKLPDGKNGLEAANEIFAKYPYASILIISAYDSVKQSFNSEKKFVSKNIKLLIKPFAIRLFFQILNLCASSSFSFVIFGYLLFFAKIGSYVLKYRNCGISIKIL